MTGPTNAASDLFAAIRREVTAEMRFLRPECRTPERIFEATANRLALEDPELFLALLHGARRRRDKEGHVARAILEEIHGELWGQPPFTSDSVIDLSLSPRYKEIRGRPRKGSVLRLLDRGEREVALRQLDALTKRMRLELVPFKEEKFPQKEKEAKEAVLTAFRPPALNIERNLRASQSLGVVTTPDGRRRRWQPGDPETPDRTALIAWHRHQRKFYSKIRSKVRRAVDVEIRKTLREIIEERTKTPALAKHEPQEWAAKCLLRLMGCPEPIPWPDAVALIKSLTREPRPDESDARP